MESLSTPTYIWILSQEDQIIQSFRDYNYAQNYVQNLETQQEEMARTWLNSQLTEDSLCQLTLTEETLLELQNLTDLDDYKFKVTLDVEYFPVWIDTQVYFCKISEIDTYFDYCTIEMPWSYVRKYAPVLCRELINNEPDQDITTSFSKGKLCSLWNFLQQKTYNKVHLNEFLNPIHQISVYTLNKILLI